MHRIKSAIMIVLLIGIIAVIGFMMGENSGITSAIVAETVACYEDSDCDDRIAQTEDVCMNPGTNDALCVSRVMKKE
ncbi:hypothetical protein HZC30_05265 [Candidatus Woesearchaeota archaeon]|nr:hypothetical protein [Candidatus Woesearchaeota archaeon]